MLVAEAAVLLACRDSPIGLLALQSHVILDYFLQVSVLEVSLQLVRMLQVVWRSETVVFVEQADVIESLIIIFRMLSVLILLVLDLQVGGLRLIAFAQALTLAYLFAVLRLKFFARIRLHLFVVILDWLVPENLV